MNKSCNPLALRNLPGLTVSVAKWQVYFLVHCQDVDFQGLSVECVLLEKTHLVNMAQLVHLHQCFLRAPVANQHANQHANRTNSSATSVSARAIGHRKRLPVAGAASAASPTGMPVLRSRPCFTESCRMTSGHNLLALLSLLELSKFACLLASPRAPSIVLLCCALTQRRA